MAVLRVSVSLIASFPDGRNVSHDDFVGLLGARVGDGIADVASDRGRWATSRIEFQSRALEDGMDQPEPSEVLFQVIETTLLHVGEWIDERRSAVQRLRENGLNVSLLVDVLMDQDQMELMLPPVLLRACGEAGLPIHLISND
jgi:hypothetical protein